jgi:hypothetical protein
MYEGTTTLSNKEYAELIIKAHKYDTLRKQAVNSAFVTAEDVMIFEITQDELNAINERRDF